MIRFLGRESYVSDWFGEKLNEANVSQLMSNTFEELAILPSFAMLACDTEQSSPSYVLYIDAIESDEVLKEAATKIEVGLQENFHYHYARHLGQLSELRVFRAEGAAQAYMAVNIRNGQRAGDIKPLALDKRIGWARVFQAKSFSAAAR